MTEQTYLRLCHIAPISRIHMLILTRRVAQTPTIGSSITLNPVEVNGGCFRIGISAPRDIPVHR